MPTSFASANKTAPPVTALGLNTFQGRQDWSQGSDIASAGSVALPVDGNLFQVTGSTQIDTISGANPGTRIAIWFNGTVAIGHNVGNIIVKGDATRTPVSDEVVVFESRDNTGLEWVEVASSEAAGGGTGVNEITVTDGGMAGGDRASVGTVGTNSLDLQVGRSAAAKSATGSQSLAIGYDAEASGLYSSSIGSGSTASAQSAVAIGQDASAETNYSVAVGSTASTTATATGAVAIGQNAAVTDAGGAAVGPNSAAVLHAVAVGEANAAAAQGVSIGYKSVVNASSTNGIAIGHYAGTDTAAGIGIGAYANAYADHAVALGYVALAYQESSIAIGNEAKADELGGSRSIVVGHEAEGYDASVVLGDRAKAYTAGGRAVSIGYRANAGHLSVAIGPYADTRNTAGGTSPNARSVAIGYNSTAAALGVGIGYYAYANGAGFAANNGYTDGRGAAFADSSAYYGGALAIYGGKANGYGTVAFRVPNYRPGTIKLGSIPLLHYTAAGDASEQSMKYGGAPMAHPLGIIDMVAAATDPVRRTIVLPPNVVAFIDDFSVLCHQYNAAVGDGEIEVTGHIREGTTATTTALAGNGANVTIAVDSSAGFSNGDWVMTHQTGFRDSAERPPENVAKVVSVPSGTSIELDFLPENVPNGSTISKLTTTGGDGNVLASTALAGFTGVRQRDRLIDEAADGYEAFTVERTVQDTGTALDIIPVIRGIAMEWLLSTSNPST